MPLAIFLGPLVLGYLLHRERAHDRAEDWERSKTMRVKLVEIHELVNSNMAFAKEGQLLALRAQVVLLRRALEGDNGDAAFADRQALRIAEAKIRELERELA